MGLFEQSTVEITDDLLDGYRNQVWCQLLCLLLLASTVLTAVGIYCAYYCWHLLCLLLLTSTVPTTVGIYCAYYYFFRG